MLQKILLVSLVVLGCARSPLHSQGGSGGGNAVETASSSTSPAKPSNSSYYVPRGIDFGSAPETIAFGSCANQNEPQPIWKQIVASDPNLFLMMGDNIYADATGTPLFENSYAKLDSIPEYREARVKIPFMAIWDDHDLGTNDGGADAPTRLVAQRAFLNYWTYVKNSLPVGQEGLYHSKIMGGLFSGRRKKVSKGPVLQVIMLDTRSFRSPLKKADPATHPNHKYEPNTDKSATLLGPIQWQWLEEQLEQKADLRIIVSSIQFIADGHGFEKWGNFPLEKQRFLDLLKKTKAKNVIILSGDRHIAAIAKMSLPGGGTLYDVTSSALNRPSNFEENDPTYLAPAYTKENFGFIKIDWRAKRANVELRDLAGKPIQEVKFNF